MIKLRIALLSPILFALTLVGAKSGQAQSFAAHPLWKTDIVVDAAGRFDSCVASRAYGDSSLISFAQTIDNSFIVIFLNPLLNPPDQWRGGATLSIDDGLAYEAPAEAVRGGVAMDLSDATTFQVLLAEGRRLRFEDLSDQSYSLEGARESLRALSDCVSAQRPAAVTPSLPSPPQPATQGVMIQMDTYATEQAAHEDWATMKKTLGPLLAGREPLMVRMTRNKDGRVFVSMRIGGFADGASAARFCEALKAKKRYCAIVPASLPPNAASSPN